MVNILGAVEFCPQEQILKFHIGIFQNPIFQGQQRFHPYKEIYGNTESAFGLLHWDVASWKYNVQSDLPDKTT